MEFVLDDVSQDFWDVLMRNAVKNILVHVHIRLVLCVLFNRILRIPIPPALPCGAQGFFIHALRIDEEFLLLRAAQLPRHVAHPVVYAHEEVSVGMQQPPHALLVRE